jgi:MFS family permease
MNPGWRGAPGVRRMLLSDLSSITGDFMAVTAMPFAVLALGGGEDEIGLVLAAQAVAVAVFLPIGGIVADRFPRRSAMVTADLLRLCSQAAIAVLLATGSASVWQLFLAQAIHGAGTGIFMPSSQAIVPEVVGEPSRVQLTNAAKQTARAMAGLAGPALGAIAVAAAGAGFAIGADAATFGISAAALSGIVPIARSAPTGGANQTGSIAAHFVDELRGALREFWGHVWLRTVVLLFCAINALSIAPFYVLGPIEASQHLGGAPAWASILVFVAIGELVGGVAALRWTPERPLAVALGLFSLWAGPLVAVAVAAPLAVILLAAFAAGAVQAIFAVFWATAMQTHLPPDRQGRLNSFDQFGGLVMVPLGFALGGFLGTTIGPTTGLFVGVIVLLAALAVALSAASVRELPSLARVPAGADLEPASAVVREREFAPPTGEHEVVIARAPARREAELTR